MTQTVTIRVLDRNTIYDRYQNTVDIETGHPLSNQWKIGPPQGWSRGETISRYDEWLEDQLKAGAVNVVNAMDNLAGILMSTGELNLVCSCAPASCHGHVIQRALKEVIEANVPDTKVECI